MSRTAFLVLGCLLPQLAAGQLAPQQARYRADQILVKPKTGVNELGQVHALLGGQSRKSFSRFGNLEVVRIPPGVSVSDVLAAYQASGLIEYAEPDYLGAAASVVTPNDLGFLSLWGLGTNYFALNAVSAWHFRSSAEPVVVAVIDSGIRYSHEDLALNMWRNAGEVAGNSVDEDGNGYVDDVYGINAITGSGDPADDDTVFNGHGTHVAGTIGAVGNNFVGVVGVAWRVQLMACKWITSTNTGSTSDAIECIDYAISKGAHIINASWYITGSSQALLDAIRAAGNRGIVFVAAAGNTNTTTGIDIDADANLRYPAGYDADNIVSVGAITKQDQLASYSNFGKTRVDLFAPGGNNTGSPNDIYSTGRNSDTHYLWLGGTSMAAAHVSGAFALMKAQFPHDSYFQLINRVFSNTRSNAALTGKCQTGGTLDLLKAVTSTSAQPRNDNFAASFEIQVPSGQNEITATGNNVDATVETSEPNSPWRSVWWHWTATSNGPVEIRTQGSALNTRLAVYTGSAVSSLTLVANNTATDGCSWSQVSFTASGSATYRITVDGYNGAMGSIKLTVRSSGSATTYTNLSFDRGTLQRSSGQFQARVTGPANQSVTLDRFSSAQKYWTNHASFTLSGSGIYDYTDTSATDAYRFYRCQIGSLKSCNAVGYADVALPAGQSMIANPLNALDNRVNGVLPSMPEGTDLHKFNDVTGQYYEVNTFISGSWTDTNVTLAPGEGAIIDLPSGRTNSFVGEYLQGYLINPVPSGYAMRSSKAPISGPVASGLRMPVVEGNLILRMVSGSYQTFVYRNGIWINDAGSQVAEPVIAVGESFWIVKPTDWEQIFSVWP